MINHMPASGLAAMIVRYRRLVAYADAIPLSLAQLAGRVAVGLVFWQSGQTKLASWPVTLQLFAYEYRLPIIDPAVAAPLATGAEILGSLLLITGLFARFGALVLLGVTATIQIFVFPSHWAEHLLWASVLLLVLARGAGAVSLDKVACTLAGHRG
ncbi:DoxX family protein [Mesorhizobium sp. KR9-304]|uniref:DoxX family protein n=1 Tax=Mesorhizobium sp. KR9-304 TaxID=3156614 RepID=UPI0032B35C4C